MDKTPWLNNINFEDLPKDLKLVAQNCGLEVAISLLKNMQGSTIRIPTKALLNLRNEYIRQKYDGSKRCIWELAKEFNMTEKHLKYLIRKKD